MPDDIITANGPQYNEDLALLQQEENDEKPDNTLEESIEEREDDSEGEIPDDGETEKDLDVEKELQRLNEEKQDKEKLAVPFNIPTFGEIKAKYPEITKDFPGLRGFFYQAAEYTKLFPSVDDAKEAIEDNEAYVAMRESVISGDSGNFIDALKSQSDQSLEAFGFDFLCKLSEKDNKAFVTVITPLYENTIRRMAADKDEEVQKAALKLSEYLFGTTEVAEGKKTFAKKIVPPQTKTDEGALHTAFNDVATKVNTSLGTIIASELNDLSPFLRKSIVNSCLEDIWTILAKDPIHGSNMKRRWERAGLNGYSEDDKTKIINTLLVRARIEIPSIRTKYRNEALGETKKASDRKIERIESGIRREVSGGRSGKSSSDQSTQSRENGNKKVDYNKMSDLDLLNL